MADRAGTATRGLALADAFGETWFRAERDVRQRELAPAVWHWTDDTAMALGVYRVLRKHGWIDQDALAAEFAAEYTRDPDRNYGSSVHKVLTHNTDTTCAMVGGIVAGRTGLDAVPAEWWAAAEPVSL